MKKAFVFDFDDTLATTKACVQVYRTDTDYTVKELSPAEFNGYILKSGEAFDFSQFRCPDLVENGEPTHLVNLAKEVHEEEHGVYILTARSGEVANAIAKFLMIHGIQANSIICVGDGDKHKSVAQCKKETLLKLKSLYDKVYFYDDNEQNIKLAKEVGVKSYLV